MEVNVVVKVMMDTRMEVIVVMDKEVNTMVVEVVTQAEAGMVMDTEAVDMEVDTKTTVDTEVDTVVVEVVTREEKAVVATQEKEVVMDTMEVENVKMENIEMVVAMVEQKQRNKQTKNN